MKTADDRTCSIEGVIIRPLRRIPDERGTIMHGVRRDTQLNPFGEVYFKKLYHGVVNGWHVHETLILNYICVLGMIKLVLYDCRETSPTHGAIEEIFIGDDNYVMVHIPTGIANGSKGMGVPFSILANVASEPHDPALKYLRIDPHSDVIPYSWERKDF
jgi:dTDP-4-dehydrorhamnose 3,5-epimerase